MTPTFTIDDLLDYTDWEREQWQAWFAGQGPEALALDLGPNRDGRINTIGELVRHIFSAELRYTERCREVPLSDTSTIPVDDVQALFAFGERSRQAMRDLLATFPADEWDAPREMKFGQNAWMVSSRKMVIQALTHELRHWAQMATLLRLAGFKPGPRDYIASPLSPPGS